MTTLQSENLHLRQLLYEIILINRLNKDQMSHPTNFSLYAHPFWNLSTHPQYSGPGYRHCGYCGVDCSQQSPHGPLKGGDNELYIKLFGPLKEILLFYLCDVCFNQLTTDNRCFKVIVASKTYSTHAPDALR